MPDLDADLQIYAILNYILNTTILLMFLLKKPEKVGRLHCEPYQLSRRIFHVYLGEGQLW